MNEKLADKITIHLLEDKQDRLAYVKVEYFIEMILSEFEKLITIFALLSVFGYAKNILIVFLVILLVRRYCGGSHCTTFIGCFSMSLLFCVIAIFGCRYISVDYLGQILVTVIHIIFMMFMAPVRSKARMHLHNRDIIKIRIKGVMGLLMTNLFFYIVSNKFRKNIFMTLLLLLIDEIIAGTINGFTKLRKGSESDEE